MGVYKNGNKYGKGIVAIKIYLMFAIEFYLD